MTGKPLLEALAPVTHPEDSAHLEDFLNREVPLATMETIIALAFILSTGVLLNLAIAKLLNHYLGDNSKS